MRKIPLQWIRKPAPTGVDGDCILVTAPKPFGNGYTYINRGSLRKRLIREVCERRNGPLGKLIALHSCDRPTCVNPNHLRAGTVRDNSADSKARKRNNFGARNGMARITDELAMQIFKAAGSQMEIASVFGVSNSLVSKIKKRKRWPHIHN